MIWANWYIILTKSLEDLKEEHSDATQDTFVFTPLATTDYTAPVDLPVPYIQWLWLKIEDYRKQSQDEKPQNYHG